MKQRHLGILVAVAALFVASLYAAAKPAGVTSVQQASTEKSPLDFQIYRSRVEPIFLKQRGEHARCYACHSQNESAFHLQKLTPGQTTSPPAIRVTANFCCIRSRPKAVATPFTRAAANLNPRTTRIGAPSRNGSAWQNLVLRRK